MAFCPIGMREISKEVMELAGLLAFGRGREIKFETWNNAMATSVVSSERYYREGYVLWWMTRPATSPVARKFCPAGLREWTTNLLQYADLRDVKRKRRKRPAPGAEPSEEEELSEQASYDNHKGDFIETPKGD
jgi:hypothetical protein